MGLAIAETHLAAEFNKEGFNIVDHYTFVICGDGCLHEGVSSEACSLAGHLGLGKLIVLYDDNLITIDGSTNLSFTEDVAARYKSYGWDVVKLKDGTDTDALQKAVEDAKNVTDKPTMIKIRTVIGQGSLKEGTHGIHGAPLKPDDLAQLKEKACLAVFAHVVVPTCCVVHFAGKAQRHWESIPIHGGGRFSGPLRLLRFRLRWPFSALTTAGLDGVLVDS